MLNDEIIGFSAAEFALEFAEPFAAEFFIDGIHYRDFIVFYDVRVVRHAVFDLILTFKNVCVVIVYADICDAVGNFHLSVSSVVFIL